MHSVQRIHLIKRTYFLDGGNDMSEKDMLTNLTWEMIWHRVLMPYFNMEQWTFVLEFIA